MKHQPAARHSAFYWREWKPRIDWTNGQRSAATRIKTAKELVAGQSHEVADAPAKPGSMGGRFSTYLLQRGAAGRKRMKAAE